MYEEQFDTTSSNLGQQAWRNGRLEEWKNGRMDSFALAQPSNLPTLRLRSGQAFQLSISTPPPLEPKASYGQPSNPPTFQPSARPPGLAAPLPFSPVRAALNPVDCPDNSSPADGPLDPWGDDVVDLVAGGGAGGNPCLVLGPAYSNKSAYHLGALDLEPTETTGWVTIDMGVGEEAVCNKPGADLRVYERGESEKFAVLGSNQANGGWAELFSGIKSSSTISYVNISFPSSALAYRYIKIISKDTDRQTPGVAGPDIFGIQALHVCALQIQPPAIGYPPQGAGLTSSSITFTGTAGSNVWVDLYTDNNQLLAANIPTNLNGGWSKVTTPPEGQYTIYAKAKRLLNGVSQTSANSPSVSFVYDTQPPVTTITQPAQDSWMRPAQVLFKGYATDNASGLHSIRQYDANGAVIENIHTASSPFPLSQNWSRWVDLSQLTTGSYTFTVRATDALGHIEAPKSRVIRIDNTPPTVTMTLPATTTVYSPSFTLGWQGGDGVNQSGVATYTVAYKRGNQAQQLWYTGPATTTVFTASKGGNYTFYFTATDQAGNVSSPVSYPLYVDLTLPAIENMAPTGFISNTRPLLSGTFDPGSGGAVLTNTFAITLDGAALQSGQVVTPGGYNVTLPATTTLSNAAHVVNVKINNPAGLDTETYTFTVDSIAPSVVITAYHRAGPNIDVDWTGSDPDPSSSNLKYDVQYKIGNLAYTGWLTDIGYSEATFRGSPGMTYTFQVRIRDGVGNQSNWVQSSVVEVSKVTKYYTFGASRVAMRQGSVVYYLHGDHLGSTSLTTNQSGALVSQARYLPYGETRFGNTGPTDFGFTAQRQDGFGLYDYNARFYSPYLNRFISADTVVPEPGNPQAWNRYSYVTNNPLKYVDPSGHEGCEDLDNCNQPKPTPATPTPEGWRIPEHPLPTPFPTWTPTPIYPSIGPQQSTPPLDLVTPSQPEAPLDAFILPGWNLGYTDPSTGQGPTFGQEAVFNWTSNEVSIFNYDGTAQGGLNGGGSLGIYGGLVFNLPNNASYEGDAGNLTITASVLEVGVAVNVFWSLLEGPGKPFGITVGYAPGLELGVSYSETKYEQVLPR